MPDSTQSQTGGCQCGATRYRLSGPLFNVQICHCRMCQRAFGSYFAPLAAVVVSDLAWLGAPPTLYRSSSVAQRGFCAHCGTPMTFQYDGEPREISIALGTLDDPAAAPPVTQFGTESRMPWFHELHRLPGETTEASTPVALFESIQSYQYGGRGDGS